LTASAFELVKFPSSYLNY